MIKFCISHKCYVSILDNLQCYTVSYHFLLYFLFRALHTAVSNKNMEAFNKILKASEKINPRDLLNAQNFALEVSFLKVL